MEKTEKMEILVSHQSRAVGFFETYIGLFRNEYDKEPTALVDRDHKGAQIALDWLYRA